MKTLNEPKYRKNIIGEIKRFDDRLGGFSRGVADTSFPSLKSIRERMLAKTKDHAKGRTLEDVAWSFACRTIDYTVRGALFARDEDDTSRKLSLSDSNGPRVSSFKTKRDPTELSRIVKKVAKFRGANEVGICELNPLWVYSHWGHFNAFFTGIAKPGDTITLPEDFRYAIVMLHAMDYEMSLRTPAVNPAIDLGYSKMAFVAPSVATFIRQLGYRAIPSGNELALNIPLAIDAGLGELGRNGLLVTQKYGPRVRISKIFTNLPLQPDKPIDIGVERFCKSCKKCSSHCPSGAISSGEMHDLPLNKSNNPGVKRWLINAEKCLGFWLKNSLDCGICIRTCPWNKPDSFFHRMIRKTAENFGSLTPVLVWCDDLFGYGKQKLHEI